jgi:hypothetical protein
MQLDENYFKNISLHIYQSEKCHSLYILKLSWPKNSTIKYVLNEYAINIDNNLITKSLATKFKRDPPVSTDLCPYLFFKYILSYYTDLFPYL